MTERLERWRRAAAKAGLVWTVSHLGYLAFMLVSRRADQGWLTLSAAMATWRQQDTGWYLDIAQHGYASGDERKAAFFPAYPLMIRIFDPVLPGGPFVAALVVSNVALFVALMLLFRLVEHEFDEPTARRTIWYLMLFPTAFFLVAAYSTSLVLCFVVGATHAVRTGRWWIAGLLGALGTATRQSALLMIFIFLFEYWRQRRRIGPDALAVLLIPTGLLGYMAYLWAVRGDPLLFSRVQQTWFRQFAPPGWSLVRAGAVFHRLPLVNNQNNTVDLAAILLMAALLLLAVAGPWRLRPDQLALPLLGGLLLGLFLSYPTTKPLQPLMSDSRFALEVFPGFAVLARLGEHRFIDATYTFVALTVQSALLVDFLHSGWVA